MEKSRSDRSGVHSEPGKKFGCFVYMDKIWISREPLLPFMRLFGEIISLLQELSFFFSDSAFNQANNFLNACHRGIIANYAQFRYKYCFFTFCVLLLIRTESRQIHLQKRRVFMTLSLVFSLFAIVATIPCASASDLALLPDLTAKTASISPIKPILGRSVELSAPVHNIDKTGTDVPPPYFFQVW